MKKRVEPDTADLIIKMQQQLTSLEKKMDTLISQSLPRPVEAKPFPKPFQQPGHTYGHGGGRQDNNYRERTLYKAICADCNKECEVPFRPSQDRPVYCKKCFSNRKPGSPFKASRDSRPQERDIAREHPFAKYQRGENRRLAGKKRPVSKKRKKA